MSQWETVGVITVLVGLFGAVIPPVVRLNNALTALQVTLAQLRELLCEEKSSNAEAHKRIWRHIDDHEKRIGQLEK
ncbi:MAG: hypothetical protein VB021_09920 [Oscillospiraceae bacterium]|nr:hypothetical protein [Oscillospiraceae bacterium]